MSLMKIKAPRWFWCVAGLYLIWNLIGCAGYLAEHLLSDAAYGKAYGAELLAIRDVIPAWATAGYAVGVWGSFVGTVLLLLRKQIALPFFYASFAGAVTGFLPSFMDSRVGSVMGPKDYGLMIFIWLACLLIIWFARKMRARRIIT